jgi:DNA mismatch repair protein MutH
MLSALGEPGGAFADEVALLTAAQNLAGHTLAEVAAAVDQRLPVAPQRDKGFIGRVAERALGLTATRAQPSPADFAALGVELKTLPVTRALRPRESTFVCYVQLPQLTEIAWEQSRVAVKLARVLFLPIESEPGIEFAQRRVGRAFLWSPSEQQRDVLRSDYIAIAERLLAGHAEAIDARMGSALQLRPKAAHGGVRVRVIDGEGVPSRLQPRAFYLRTSFTEQLLRASLRSSPHHGDAAGTS